MIRDWYGDIDHRTYDLFTEVWKLKKELQRMKKPEIPEKARWRRKATEPNEVGYSPRD